MKDNNKKELQPIYEQVQEEFTKISMLMFVLVIAKVCYEAAELLKEKEKNE
ncbi:MAG: hypothetical protein QXI16_01300 [Sulfolobaceae archaeon]